MEEYKKKTNTGDDVLIKVLPTESNLRPTAVLFGWFAAQHRHVLKYSDIYSSMGYNTVQTIAPASTVFPMHPRSSARFLLSILRILSSDSRLHAGGIVFQMFSNGGAICAPHLSQMFACCCGEIVQAEDVMVVKTIKEAMCAIVFDSCPVYIRSHLGSRAIVHGMKIPGGPLAFLVKVAFFLLLVFQCTFIINLPRWFWTSLMEADYGCPELFIYSTADYLMDAPKLDELVSHRKETKSVRTFRVDDAEHVLIFRKHPEKYVEVIKSVNEWGVEEWRRRKRMPLFEIEAR